MTRRARWPSRDVLALAAIFALSGTMHFVRSQPFERIVPHALPHKRELVLASGALELVCAAGLLAPSTRRAAGAASAGLLLAVFPANVQMAVDLVAGRASVPVKVASLVRLPLQWPMIRTGWRAYRAG